MLIETLLPIAHFSMMITMGMSLVVDDVRRVVEHPKAALIGIGSLLLIPLLGFAVANGGR